MEADAKRVVNELSRLLAEANLQLAITRALLPVDEPQEEES